MPITVRGGEYLTVTELADKTGEHRNNIIYWINNGSIKAERKGLSEKSPFIIPVDEAERVIKLLTQPKEETEAPQ